MAQIATQTIVITVSTVVKNNDPTPNMVGDDLVQQLEAVVAELVDDKLIVEAMLISE